MAGDNDNKWSEQGGRFRLISYAVGIPAVLGIYPLVGYFLFLWIGGLVGWESLKFIGLLLGLFAGLRECMRLVRILNKEMNK